MKKNVLLLCGGGGTEHDISIVSAKYIEATLNKISDIQVFYIEISKAQIWQDKKGLPAELRANSILKIGTEKIKIDYAIPCIHGPPGETGEIQSLFELYGISYFGPTSEASRICFNKATTKLWLNALGIPNTPFKILTNFDEDNLNIAKAAFDEFHAVFIKAASQGSSIGCYKVTSKADLESSIKDAFKYSNYCLIEKAQKARELEVATYEYKGKIIATVPGEIIAAADTFYTYDEKYSSQSHSKTEIKAQGLPQETVEKIKSYAIKAFKGLKLKDLSRIDFFYTTAGEIVLNEINTFPGMTPISMFPKMLEANGDNFTEFLKEKILS